MKQMKRLSIGIFASMVLALAASPLLAEKGTSGRTRVLTRKAPAKDTARVEPKAGAASYSAQANIVTRVQGTSFFKTAIDITNNTDVDGVTARMQYCYTFNGTFQCSPEQSFNMVSFDNFHTDDIVEYLGSLGALVPGAEAASFGTFLVTFDNLPSANGWEGTVQARTYSAYQDNPANGTLAIAYYGSLFFESATETVLGTIRDTQLNPTDAGALRTNIGVTNTDIYGHGTPINVQLSFYDVTEGSATNGQRVGDFVPINGLQAGEVRQINNVFTFAHIPANVESCIAFADVTSDQTGTNPGTIEGYINILSAGTNDGAFFEMKCSAGCPTFD
jgi:hypothetical protein